MRKLFFVSFIALIFIMTMSSCGSGRKDGKSRAEITKIIESRSCDDLLNDLYIGSKGDIQALARILHATPSSIERLRNRETKPTQQFEERIREVSIYYALNDQSFTKLRSICDDEYGWYEHVLHFPKHHPGVFWTCNIILILLLAFAALVFIWPFLLELLIFFIAWVFLLICSPTDMNDKYQDSINPTIECIK